MNRRELEDAIRKEVEQWPGVTVEFSDGAKHPKVKLWYLGQMLARPYAGTPSDSSFGLHNCLGDMRRVMKQLGAKRSKPEPSKDEDEAPYRKPNNGAAVRPDPVAGEKARPKPTVTEQLVEQGAPPPAADPEPDDDPDHSKGDEPADPLLAELAACGLEVVTVGPVSREGIVVAAVDMIEDGVYFRLPDQIYHAVPALGAGSLVALNISPGDFWCGSWLDPDRPELDEEQTEAQLVGKAYHCARLEPDAFATRFCREPTKDDFAEEAAKRGAVWNGTEAGEKLAEMGSAKKRAGEGVAGQCQRLEDEGYGGVIWPLEYARWQDQLGTRTPLKAEVWDDIERDMERLQGVGEIHSKLTGGAAEVSVFWTDENNIRRKARFDYLQPGAWTDFKTFENRTRKRLDNAIADAIRYNRYYITAASYREAAEAIRDGAEIRGAATEAERDLVAQIRLNPHPLECWFVFQQKGGVPNLLAREFVFEDVPLQTRLNEFGATEEQKAAGREATSRPTLLYQKAMTEIDYAKRLFALYSGVYGPGEPWAPLEPTARISDLDFAPAWLEGRYD